MARPILVVEDDPDSRQMLTCLLELEGYAVLTACNGSEALTLAQDHLPALILLDLMMPVMTGEQFRRAQLSLNAISDIPVVVLSAHHQAGQIARRMNAAGCLGKPVNMERLLALCTKVQPH